MSGFQRRIDNSTGTSRNKKANRLFRESFKETGLDDYLKALSNPNHPSHGSALRSTYGPNRQNYMLPLMGFYFASLPDQAKEERRAKRVPERFTNVEVQFICTSTLGQDFRAAGEAWGIDLAPMEDHAHASSMSSDHVLATTPLIPGEQKVISQLVTLSNTSMNWFSSLYAEDIMLYHQHCRTRERYGGGPNFDSQIMSETNFSSGSLVDSVLTYRCPVASGAGSCHFSGSRRRTKER